MENTTVVDGVMWITCPECEMTKPFTAFTRKSPDTLCQNCWSKQLARLRRPPGKPRKAPAVKDQCPYPSCDRLIMTAGHCVRHYALHRLCGLSLEDFYARHNERCPIESCGNTGTLQLDHDRACCPGNGARRCGQCERAFICSRCNRALYWIENGLGEFHVIPGSSPLVEALLRYVAQWKTINNLS